MMIMYTQGHPFRESLQENKTLYYGLLSVGGIALSGATEFVPEVNSALQLVPMTTEVNIIKFYQVINLQTIVD